MNTQDLKIFIYSIYVCINSKENPDDTTIIINYENGKIKETTLNKKTKIKAEILL